MNLLEIEKKEKRKKAKLNIVGLDIVGKVRISKSLVMLVYNYFFKEEIS